eukprot:gene16104-21882_t
MKIIRLVVGELLAKLVLDLPFDLCITGTRVTEAMIRIDPEGVEERKHKAVRRRVYRTGGPHHLWHMDGNHKLIPYHLVIHGAIDGFTRACVFLRCSDNNTSHTVINGYMTAIDKYDVPSRIRVDKGGENVLVARFMLQQRGLGRNTVIAGKSVHNQRIERFWRDVRKEVT